MIDQILDDLFQESLEDWEKATSQSWANILQEYHDYLTKECGEGEFITEEWFCASAVHIVKLERVKAWLNQHVNFNRDLGLWSIKISDLGMLQQELNKCNCLERQAKHQWIWLFDHFPSLAPWMALSYSDCPLTLWFNITGQFFLKVPGWKH